MKTMSLEKVSLKSSHLSRGLAASAEQQRLVATKSIWKGDLEKDLRSGREEGLRLNRTAESWKSPEGQILNFNATCPRSRESWMSSVLLKVQKKGEVLFWNPAGTEDGNTEKRKCYFLLSRESSSTRPWMKIKVTSDCRILETKTTTERFKQLKALNGVKYTINCEPKANTWRHC